MKPTEKQIEEIAEDLECGMTCFFNLKTGEIKSVHNTDDWLTEEDPWAEDIAEIENNEDDYFKLDGLESNESFRIMADYAESVDNEKLKDNLIFALNGPKPFRNFKYQIDNSGVYREKWFEYKKMRYIQYVKDLVEMIEDDSAE